jgi:hypothetical protein
VKRQFGYQYILRTTTTCQDRLGTDIRKTETKGWLLQVLQALEEEKGWYSSYIRSSNR